MERVRKMYELASKYGQYVWHKRGWRKRLVERVRKMYGLASKYGSVCMA